jgi:hypothetical protein
MRLQLTLATLIIGVVFFTSSCSNSANTSGEYDVFFQSNSSVSSEIYFTPIPDSRLYVAHTGENHSNYGSALDIDGDTFFMNGNIWCKYIDDVSEVKLVNLSDSNQLYLSTMDSNRVDTLFHYMILTDRGPRLNAPKGKEYLVFVFHKHKGIVGLYLLIHPNRETNSTTKDFICLPSGELGVMDTTKVIIVRPSSKSDHFE